jgi:hypothetical protein
MSIDRGVEKPKDRHRSIDGRVLYGGIGYVSQKRGPK